MNTKLKYNLLFKLSLYTPNTVLRFVVSKIVLNKYFILQVWIQLIISDSKDMYNYKRPFFPNKLCSLELCINQRFINIYLSNLNFNAKERWYKQYIIAVYKQHNLLASY